MNYEKSCGAVVLLGSGASRRVLLIRHTNGGHWAFPKGHVEENETEEETALREIREETGLTVTLDTGFRGVTTYSPKKETTKDVIYFIAFSDGADIHRQAEEVLEAGWFSFEEAEKTVTHENDRQVLAQAKAYLEKN